MPKPAPRDLDPATLAIFDEVRPFTKTSAVRVAALVSAVTYLVRTEVPGEIIECGVWRGGSMMAVARRLLDLDAADRHLHLLDTFGESPPPTVEDGPEASSWFEEHADVLDSSPTMQTASLAEVRANIARVGYPDELLHFVPGLVEETVPAHAPASIALLRMDTDWYGSTRHQLEHLWPRMVPGGIVIIDDYGRWDGCRRATDEYFQDRPVLFHRVDEAARVVQVQR